MTDHADLLDEIAAAHEALDAMRDRLDRALLSAEQHQAARGHAVNTTQLLTALLERSIAAHVRHGQGDLARELSEALKKAIER